MISYYITGACYLIIFDPNNTSQYTLRESELYDILALFIFSKGKYLDTVCWGSQKVETCLNISPKWYVSRWTKNSPVEDKAGGVLRSLYYCVKLIENGGMWDNSNDFELPHEYFLNLVFKRFYLYFPEVEPPPSVVVTPKADIKPTFYNISSHGQENTNNSFNTPKVDMKHQIYRISRRGTRHTPDSGTSANTTCFVRF
jgi:hypothetical protein